MIVVAARCYNEIRNIDRFLKGYSWADKIVISDGGSTDGSREYLEHCDVDLLKFDMGEIVNGYFWNMDAPHMNFVLDHAKSLNPDWLVFDDLDCVPTRDLRESAKDVFREVAELQDYQINAFRLYMWGEKEFFPKMNDYFNHRFTSIWAWQPKKVDIRADPDVRHGTLVGLATENIFGLKTPYSLLHRSWHPDTIDEKIRRYNALGLSMSHPLDFAGTPEPLPEWAVE